ncbi:hypothetical protein Scep_028894 [Stephania cephalantha]|uniref:Uncharacterized protein n=1 Tax=Stephania cephalantha TaxID=152367 RepID=A0AAP0EDX7_9MAGN
MVFYSSSSSSSSCSRRTSPLQIEGRLLAAFDSAAAPPRCSGKPDESRRILRAVVVRAHLEAEEDRIVVALELGEVEKLGRDAVEFRDRVSVVVERGLWRDLVVMKQWRR